MPCSVSEPETGPEKKRTIEGNGQEQIKSKQGQARGFTTVELHVYGVVSSFDLGLGLHHPELVGRVVGRGGVDFVACGVAQLRFRNGVVLLVHHEEIALQREIAQIHFLQFSPLFIRQGGSGSHFGNLSLILMNKNFCPIWVPFELNFTIFLCGGIRPNWGLQRHLIWVPFQSGILFFLNWDRDRANID